MRAITFALLAIALTMISTKYADLSRIMIAYQVIAKARTVSRIADFFLLLALAAIVTAFLYAVS